MNESNHESKKPNNDIALKEAYNDLLAISDTIKKIANDIEQKNNKENSIKIDDTCYWRLSKFGVEEKEVYYTGCNRISSFISGTPKENDYKYCPYCGKRLYANMDFDFLFDIKNKAELEKALITIATDEIIEEFENKTIQQEH